MEDHTIIICFALALLTIIECWALYLGFDGAYLASVVGIFGAVAGYEIKNYRTP